MSNLKNRIEGLLSSTSTIEVVNACNEAIKSYSEYTAFNLPLNKTEDIENTVAETLISKIESVKESAVDNFISVEKRIQGMKFLGVRKAIAAIKESDLAKHPASMYVLERLFAMDQSAEWMVAEAFCENLKRFEWDSLVKEHLNIITSNIEKYKEDIKIYKAVHEGKNSRSAFIFNSLDKQINEYLNDRSSAKRTELMETLSKHTYDPNVKALYSIISESDISFNLKSGSNNAYVNKIYSPVIISENDEVFAAYGKAYVKNGNKMRPLVEEEYKKLPQHFTFISKFLNQDNVEITENRIKIFSKDKKVEIVEESEGLVISINGKKVNINEFHQVYLNSGIFRFDEKETINAVNILIENWDSIFELDFAKSIFPRTNPNRRADIFKLDENTYINTWDSVMNENKFYNDCNATQARNMIMEFASYDLGETYKDFLVNEEKVIKELTEQKEEYFSAINYLTDRKTQLENHPNEEVRESDEVKELITALDEELSTLKEEYRNIQNKINDVSYVTEGLGANVGDEVEYLKKKQ
jgi:hypothetical protein